MAKTSRWKRWPTRCASCKPASSSWKAPRSETEEGRADARDARRHGGSLGSVAQAQRSVLVSRYTEGKPVHLFAERTFVARSATFTSGAIQWVARRTSAARTPMPQARCRCRGQVHFDEVSARLGLQQEPAKAGAARPCGRPMTALAQSYNQPLYEQAVQLKHNVIGASVTLYAGTLCMNDRRRQR